MPVTRYASGPKTTARVLLIFVLLVGTDEEFVLACFAGMLELNNITELAKMFDAAEVEELAKASEAVSVEFGINPNPSNGEFTLVYNNNGDLAGTNEHCRSKRPPGIKQ